MQKVSEVAQILGVSKQAVHKRIKKPQYQEYIVRHGSIIYIKDEAISMLRTDTVNPVDENINQVDKLVDSKVVEMYEKLLISKDEAINQLTKQVDNLTRLLEQQQILTLNSQAEVKLLKDESAPGHDPLQESKSSSWFGRIFGKK